MLAKLRSNSNTGSNFLRLNTCVTQIAQDPDLPKTGPVEVTSQTHGGASHTSTYAHVITTTTLPSLRSMNLDHARLTPSQSTALRELQYGAAAKVGVKFLTAWWEVDDPDSGLAPKFGPIKGGISYTDRMARMVVYPSHGLDSGAKSTVLISAYGWTNDALQLSSLFGEDSKERLKDLICRDLVAVHGLHPERGLAFLKDQWVDAFTFSWTTALNTMGVFSLGFCFG